MQKQGKELIHFFPYTYEGKLIKSPKWFIWQIDLDFCSHRLYNTPSSEVGHAHQVFESIYKINLYPCSSKKKRGNLKHIYIFILYRAHHLRAKNTNLIKLNVWRCGVASAACVTEKKRLMRFRCSVETILPLYCSTTLYNKQRNIRYNKCNFFAAAM